MSDHYKNGYFFNPKSWGYNDVSTGGAGKFVKWRWEKLFKGSVKIPSMKELPILKPKIYKDNREIEGDISVTWLGHSTFLVQVKGRFNFITDPIFSQRSSPFQWVGPKRIRDSPILPKDIPSKIDFVVISHNHYDHLDYNSCVELKKHSDPLFLVPLKIKSWFESKVSKNVVEMDWYESHEEKKKKCFENVKIHFVPAQHWSNRILFDKNATLWGGWVIEYVDEDNVTRKLYFVGDTGYSDKLFKLLGERYGPIDVGFVPIGAYSPRYIMQSHHVNPEEAVNLALEVKIKKSFSMHHSTFILTDEPVLQPREILTNVLEKRNLDPDFFVTLSHGETRAVNFENENVVEEEEGEEEEEEEVEKVKVLENEEEEMINN